VMNFKEEFRQSVIDNFISEYERGRTPNPCVQCNRHVKFEILMQKMKELGCDRLVTGHYARIRRDSATGRYRLLRARGQGKDQSYVLYMLNQEQLASSYFPMGEIADKAHTREIARSFNLGVADKPDSQEICFVSDAGGYHEFLRKQKPEIFERGNIVDPEGKTVGEHEGVADFTIGQRRGIGVASKRPLYVLELKPKENQVIVGPVELLETRKVHLDSLFWSAVEETEAPQKVMAKIRYNMDPQSAVLYGGPKPYLEFDKPVRAVTPGQIAVAYRGQSVLAGGTIADAVGAPIQTSVPMLTAV